MQLKHMQHMQQKVNHVRNILNYQNNAICLYMFYDQTCTI